LRPSPVRIVVHWLLVIESLLLLLTGVYLQQPRLGGPYGLAVFIHLVVGYVLLTTVAFRLYWALLGAGDPSKPVREAVAKIRGAGFPLQIGRASCRERV